MPPIPVHDLPVYRLSPQQYDKELEALTHKIINDPPGSAFPTSEASKAQAREGLMGHFRGRKFGNWRFNEVVGHLRLTIVEGYVSGNYFSRRIQEPGIRIDEPVLRETRTRTKVFLEGSPLVREVPLPEEANNQACFEVVRSYVDECRRKLPRRHFDDEWLIVVGPYLDWQGLAHKSRR